MSTTPVKKKEHIPQLQLVRAIAIIGVLSVHASAAATVTMKDSAYFFLYNFANTFMRFGTPTFILLSSFVLFYSYYNRPLDGKLIKGFYKKRLLYIIIPYILFSAIYFVYGKIRANLPYLTSDALLQFLEKLAKGEVYAHLYFIFISVQFYLLFPLLLWVVKRWKNTVYWLIPTGFLLQWAFFLMNEYYWRLEMKGSLAPSYFLFFFTGAAIGIFFPKLKDWFAVTREYASPKKIAVWCLTFGIWLTLALSHVMLYYNVRANGTRYHILIYEFLWSFHTLFSALVVIGLSFFIYRHLPVLLSKTLYRLGQLSFGVYLIHLIFLFIYDDNVRHFGSSLLEHARYFGSFVFMLVGSWLVVGLVTRFVPYSWVLFGTVQKEPMPLEAYHLNRKKRFGWKWLIGSALVVAIIAGGAAYLWMKDKDTTNHNKRQELLAVESAEQIQKQYDVIVAGTDPEGVAAAVSAARNGLSVLLVDGKDRKILGGLMTVGGLNTLDLNYSPKQSSIPGSGHNFLNKGIFQEWYDQVEGTSFDVNTAANVFYKMVKAEENIDLLMGTRSMEPLASESADGIWKVSGMNIVTGDGQELEVAAQAVIDATQDGDIAAAAGATYTLGREDIGNGDAQMAVTLVFALKGMTQSIWDSFGKHPDTGIDAMSAWGFPSAKNYESSNPERVKLRGLNIGRQNDDTILINAMHIFGINPLDPASIKEALEIGNAEAPRIVEYLKTNFTEFKDLELAYTFDELYVRESRHIQGEYRLTMADLLANRDHWDAIAYGSYDVDIQAASHLDTGYVLYSPKQYGVPFRTLVPKTVDHLLVVGRAASFDSLPHGSARVIPLGMATGEAAGAAAKLAKDHAVTFRFMSGSKELIGELRGVLASQGMDLKMESFETPYYINHKAYRGLKAAVSMLLTSGNHDNKAFDLDGKSNMQRIVYSLYRVKQQHSDFFHGDPAAAIAGVENPAGQALSVEQTVKTIANAMDNATAADVTVEDFVANGWFAQETLDSIADPAAITNGEFFMLIRDLVEYYAGVVYE